jgi:toxin ParE1/3/4
MTGRKRPVTWSRTARADLSQIWTYYAHAAGRQVADMLVLNINQTVRKLENYPFSGRSRDEVRPGLRSVLAKPYVVLYRLREDQSAEIVRILDGLRDVEGILSEDSGEQQ